LPSQHLELAEYGVWKFHHDLRKMRSHRMP